MRPRTAAAVLTGGGAAVPGVVPGHSSPMRAVGGVQSAARPLLLLIRPTAVCGPSPCWRSAAWSVRCARRRTGRAWRWPACASRGSWRRGRFWWRPMPRRRCSAPRMLRWRWRRQAGGWHRGVPADVPIFAVQSYQQSLPFYLRRPVVLVDYRDEFDLGLTRGPAARHRDSAAIRGRVAAAPQRFAVMPPGTRDKLSALGLPMREIARFPDRVIISRR